MSSPADMDPVELEDVRENVPFGERVVSLMFNTSSTVCGIAIYNDSTDSLSLDALPVSLESIEGLLFDLKNFYSPTLWLLHPKICSNPPLLDAILCSPVDGSPNFYRYNTPKSAVWNSEAGLDLMCNRLHVRELTSERNQHIYGGSDSATEHHGSFSYHLLSSVLDMQNNEMRSAAGSLLAHMLTSGLSVLPNTEFKGVTISRLLPLEHVACMRADADTLRALSVFVQEVHPNALKKGRSKEGLSLFTLLDRTRSNSGRSRLREWLSRPFCDTMQISQRLDGVALMARAENLDWAAGISKHLKKLRDIPLLLTKVKKAEGHCKDWVHLMSSLSSVVSIAESVLDFISTSPALPAAEQEPSDQVEPALEGAELERAKDAKFLASQWRGVQLPTLIENLQELENVIDMNESTVQEQLVVRSGYDAELDNLRDVYAGLDVILTNTVQTILTRYPDIDKAQVEYVPQLGFMVSISADEAYVVNNINDIAMNSGIEQSAPAFDFVYREGALDKYKTAETLELDYSVGDIRHAVQDKQRVLLVAIEDTLLLCEGPWRHAAHCAASLDATMSLGVVARERDFVRPSITEDRIIAIKSGRHPLQELSVDDFVPNDTFLDAQRNIAVVTGPNSSGKSVYLKQVGLLCYMAHVGSFLPCERAYIGMCDRLLTRISSIESSSTPQSAFTLDLCQMSRLLKAHTPRSLCLIDEFGQGTSPVDGISLLASTIDHFSQSPQRCRCLYVVNYTEVLTPGLLAEATIAHVLCYRMTSYYPKAQDAGNNDANESSVPLYKLEVGVSPTAQGIHCAADAGVLESIVKRAKEVREHIQAGTPIHAQEDPALLQNYSVAHLLRSFLAVRNWSDVSQAPDAKLSALQVLLKRAAALESRA